MDIVFSLLILFITLIICILKNIYIFYPLLFGLSILILLALKRGYKIKEILTMLLKGALKTNQIYILLILIGVSTAIWMSSGTISAFIFYGIKIINPNLFIISVFFITLVVSFIIGSSFGTVGTIGIVFITLAKASNINLDLIAGAIITAAYIGERISPLSSSANLIAILTETNLYINLKRMTLSTVVPFIITVSIYVILSIKNPLSIKSLNINTELQNSFNLNLMVLIPALIILIFVIFKIDVRIALLVSIMIACVESLLLQSRSFGEIVHFIIFGFEMNSHNNISNILYGGGILPMLKTILIVIISSCYAGIFEGTKMLKDFETILEITSQKFGTFFSMILASIAGCFIGCSQTFAIITAHQLMSKIYIKRNIKKSDLALDIGNTALIIAPLVPWNIASTFPALILSVGAGYIPYAFFLYFVPLFGLIKVIDLNYKKYVLDTKN
ncbi:Na+/H+ antiporter NhaC family protein [Lysinibacillus sp. RC79]|uniref:Na+/H+ antiporter NhaC family protein n=1 Tax=Lysinibacillus sp. RC79 TaxID=3156296 RepID=UPI003518E376